MIDLHTHILPGLDDGAADLETSIEMARMAYADGVHTIAATPHNLDWKADMGRVQVHARVAELQAALDEAGVSVRLVPGVEAYLTPDIARQADGGQVFCLGDTHYILVELPLQQYPTYVEQAIFDLQIKGLTPILAHPERNAILAKEPQRLYQLVEKGLLTQLTAASLTGTFGQEVQEAAELFLTHKMAHVIASDAHGLGSRSPVLSEAVQAAAALVGQEKATAMVSTVPEAILAGKRFYVESAIPIKPKKKGWFWQK